MNIYDLKDGDIVEVVKPYSDRKVEFTVIRNIIDDVLFLFNENNGKGIHLFYDDPEDMWYAKANFDIDTDKKGTCKKETIEVLTRNAIKCLQCCTVLESKYQHDFQSCQCSNQAFVDGGLSYVRVGAVDLDLIEDLSEYATYDKVEFEAKQKEHKTAQDIRDQELLIKLFEGYNV